MLKLATLLSKRVTEHKLFKLLTVVFIFTIFYTMLEDDEFEGLQRLSEDIKYGNQNRGRPTSDILNIKGVVDEHRKYFKDVFFEKFYFSLITVSTIGYGDIYPSSIRARVLVIMQTIIMLYISTS